MKPDRAKFVEIIFTDSRDRMPLTKMPDIQRVSLVDIEHKKFSYRRPQTNRATHLCNICTGMPSTLHPVEHRRSGGILSLPIVYSGMYMYICDVSQLM